MDELKSLWLDTRGVLSIKWDTLPFKIEDRIEWRGTTFDVQINAHSAEYGWTRMISFIYQDKQYNCGLTKRKYMGGSHGDQPPEITCGDYRLKITMGSNSLTFTDTLKDEPSGESDLFLITELFKPVKQQMNEKELAILKIVNLQQKARNRKEQKQNQTNQDQSNQVQKYQDQPDHAQSKEDTSIPPGAPPYLNKIKGKWMFDKAGQTFIITGYRGPKPNNLKMENKKDETDQDQPDEDQANQGQMNQAPIPDQPNQDTSIPPCAPSYYNLLQGKMMFDKAGGTFVTFTKQPLKDHKNSIKLTQNPQNSKEEPNDAKMEYNPNQPKQSTYSSPRTPSYAVTNLPLRKLKEQVRKIKRRDVKFAIGGLIVFLIVTNPSLKDFKDFEGYPPYKAKYMSLKRTDNYILFSVFEEEENEYDGGSHSPSTYLGIADNFFSLDD